METVMITGASGGLGSALKHAFSIQGFNTVLNRRRSFDQEIGDPTIPHSHYIVYGDVTDPWVVEQLGKVALDKGVSILINNAGIYQYQPFPLVSVEDIKEVLETNLLAPILITQAVWPAFKANGGGLVININSLAGAAGAGGESIYCASKHGLSGFSKALQFDGTKDNVRVINVYLGAMKTEMSKGRIGWENFIDPVEVADQIVGLCVNHRTLRISEITITRNHYV